MRLCPSVGEQRSQQVDGNRGGVAARVGVRVGEFAPVNPSLSMTQVAAQSYAVFSHRGPVAEIRETVAEIGRDWLPRSGYKHFRVDDGAPDFIERYGEGFDPKAGAGDVEIWLPVAK